MKKFVYLAATTLVFGAATGYAGVNQHRISQKPPSAPKGMTFKGSATPFKGDKFARYAKAGKGTTLPTRADDGELSMDWRYCSDPYNAFVLPQNTIKGAIMVTSEMATKFAGAKVSAVQISNPLSMGTPQQSAMGYYPNPVKTATVWLSKSLTEEPFISATGELSEWGFDWSSIDLPSDYVIEAETPFYIGYTFDVPSSPETYGLVTDYTVPDNNNSAFIYTSVIGYNPETGEPVLAKKPDWRAQGDLYGNLCVSATFSGDMLPTNEAELVLWDIPGIVTPGESFMFKAMVQNQAANELKSLDLTFKAKGCDDQTRSIEITDGSIEYLDLCMVVADFTCDIEANNIPYSISITKVNGAPYEDPNPVEGYLLSIENGYDRNILVEEATGTWCGYCVVGYAGMEYMRETYEKDGFIGVALHDSDPMQVLGTDECYDFFNARIDGFPTSFINRGEEVYPSPEELEEAFLYFSEFPAYAKIEASLQVDGDQVKLHTTSYFSADEDDAKYKVAYAVTQDHMGPYLQSNYLSGEEGETYGFGELPEHTPLYYYDVARPGSQPGGVEGSLPSKIAKGQGYDFDTTFSLGNVPADKFRVVAMIVNDYTGAVENSVLLTPDGYNAVAGVSAENVKVSCKNGKVAVNGDYKNVAVYDMAGRRQGLSVAPGFYVVLVDGKAFKVMSR